MGHATVAFISQIMTQTLENPHKCKYKIDDIFLLFTFFSYPPMILTCNIVPILMLFVNFTLLFFILVDSIICQELEEFLEGGSKFLCLSDSLFSSFIFPFLQDPIKDSPFLVYCWKLEEGPLVLSVCEVPIPPTQPDLAAHYMCMRSVLLFRWRPLKLLTKKLLGSIIR